MLPETFKKSMEKHYKNDKVVGKKEVNRIERKLHEHSRSVVKIFRVAEQSGQHDRALRNATVHTNGQTPSLRGAEKDHKASDKIEMRPIVNAMFPIFIVMFCLLWSKPGMMEPCALARKNCLKHLNRSTVTHLQIREQES